jgi:hypothetical protein
MFRKDRSDAEEFERIGRRHRQFLERKYGPNWTNPMAAIGYAERRKPRHPIADMIKIAAILGVLGGILGLINWLIGVFWAP